MNRIFPIFISCVLFAQINVMTLPTRDIQDALFYERKGDIDKAKIIYQKLLEKNPKNRQAYQRLKEILKRTEELSEALELIKYWINIHPNDLQAHIELGEIFYLNNDRLNADKVWESFESNFGKNQSAYRMLLHTYSRLSLITKMKELVYRGRIKFNKKDLLSLDLANYYYARQTYDLSLDELLIYIKSNPSNENLLWIRYYLLVMNQKIIY